LNIYVRIDIFLSGIVVAFVVVVVAAAADPVVVVAVEYCCWHRQCLGEFFQFIFRLKPSKKNCQKKLKKKIVFEFFFGLSSLFCHTVLSLIAL